MAKFIKSITLLLLFCLTASAATAMVEVQSNKNDQRKGLRVTSFLDYPPFGEVVTAEYSVPKMHTIYDQFIENYAKDNHYDLAYVLDKPYKDLVMDILRGEIDLILGIYYDTDIYNGIEYVYPSILNNPMTAVMLPNRIGEVKKMDDLKKLKGGMDSREHLAGYVSKAMKITMSNILTTRKSFIKNCSQEKSITFSPAIITALSKHRAWAFATKSVLPNNRYGICLYSSVFPKHRATENRCMRH